MVLPQFQPASAPGSAARAAIDTLGATQSYMDRASRLRMDQEIHALRVQQEDILRPAREAQARATVAAANNQVASLKQTEDMRAIAHGEMPRLRDEWAQASQIDDPGQRVRALLAVLGKATKYESVSELKGEVDVWKNVVASQAVTERTLESVNARLEIEGNRVRAANEQLDIKTAAAKELADVKAQHAKELQALRNQAPKGDYAYLVSAAQAARDAGDEETAQLLDAQIKRRNHIAQPYSDAERITTLATEAEAAEKEGNPALAKALRDRITYLTKRNNSGKDREAILQSILDGGSATAPAKPAVGADLFKDLKF